MQAFRGSRRICKRRSRNPASILASRENGGVFISPCSHTSGFSAVTQANICQERHIRKRTGGRRCLRRAAVPHRGGPPSPSQQRANIPQVDRRLLSWLGASAPRAFRNRSSAVPRRTSCRLLLSVDSLAALNSARVECCERWSVDRTGVGVRHLVWLQRHVPTPCQLGRVWSHLPVALPSKGVTPDISRLSNNARRP